MTKLLLADGLSLPPDLATHVTLIAGKRGSGKTNTAKRIIEQLHRAKVPFGILDPVDVHWGLKAGRDGTRRGGLEEIYVFGGKHADYPLYPTGGHLMANLFVDHRISAVMEMREWSGADRARFVRDFATRLLERNTEPFALIAEEAHDLMPQQAMGEEKGSLGAMLRLVKLGRSGGIGLVELTQRLAALNKTATTQADVLVMHRTTGPQDRKALNDWIAEHHASDEQRNDFLRSLPELKTGEAFVWAPDFPEDKPLGLSRHRILECETFNSHATPKVGEKRVEPKELTKVDLDRLAKAMASTVEKAKAEDPAELRKTIGILRAELKGAQKAAPLPAVVTETVEKAVLKDGQVARLEKAAERLDKLAGSLITDITRLRSALNAVSSTDSRRSQADAREHGRSSGHVDGTAVRAGGVGEPRASGAARTQPAGPRPPAPTTDGISARSQRFLDAAATLTTLGVEVSRETVSGWIGVHPRGGSVGEVLKGLVDAGLIEMDRGRITVTDRGQQSAGYIDPAQAVDRAKAGMSPRQRRIFDIVAGAYPGEISKSDVAQAMGIHERGGSFGEDIGRLRGRGLITAERGVLRARDFLFAEAIR